MHSRHSLNVTWRSRQTSCLILLGKVPQRRSKKEQWWDWQMKRSTIMVNRIFFSPSIEITRYRDGIRQFNLIDREGRKKGKRKGCDIITNILSSPSSWNESWFKNNHWAIWSTDGFFKLVAGLIVGRHRGPNDVLSIAFDVNNGRKAQFVWCVYMDGKKLLAPLFLADIFIYDYRAYQSTLLYIQLASPRRINTSQRVTQKTSLTPQRKMLAAVR